MSVSYVKHLDYITQYEESMSKAGKDRIQLDVSSNVKEALDKIANEQGRTMSDLVKEGIVAIIQRYGRGIM